MEGATDSSLKFAIKCAVTCIVLHNICLDQNDPWDDDRGDYDHGNDDRNDDLVCGNI